jgi:hypothetical protein
METDGSLSLSNCVCTFSRRCRSCECCGCTHAVVVVLPGSVETTPFDDAVAHSINQSGAPSSASASSVMHPPPPATSGASTRIR